MLYGKTVLKLRQRMAAKPKVKSSVGITDKAPHLARSLLPAGGSRNADRSLRRPLQPSALPREPEQRHTR